MKTADHNYSLAAQSFPDYDLHLGVCGSTHDFVKRLAALALILRTLTVGGHSLLYVLGCTA